jgi:hypothetical protein
MNPSNSTPGDEPKRDQHDKSGGSSDIKPSAASAEQSASSQQPVKAKPKTLQEEIREILQAKAIKAADCLIPVTGASKITKAAETFANRATRELMAAATKYARKSANALKITELDVLKEILAEHGIAARKPLRSESAKKNAADGKKGGRHGS